MSRQPVPETATGDTFSLEDTQDTLGQCAYSFAVRSEPAVGWGPWGRPRLLFGLYGSGRTSLARTADSGKRVSGESGLPGNS